MKNTKQGSDHQSQINRIRRVEGQIRGIGKMIEEQRYCMDIITQLKAVRSALATVERNIVDTHLKHCVHQALQSKSSRQVQKAMDEISDLLKKAQK